jgi:hypothetical protein
MRSTRVVGALVGAFSLLATAPALAAGSGGGGAGVDAGQTRAAKAAQDAKSAQDAKAAPRTDAAAPATLTADPLPTWQTDGIVWSLAYAHGVLYAGGDFSHVRPPGAKAGEKEEARENFAAFDATTGQLLPCAPSFTGGTGSVRALDASPDGQTLYVGGSFGSVTLGGKKTGVSNTVALNTGGCTLHSGFRPGVAATVRTIDSTGDTVYLGGDFATVGATSRRHVAAVSTGGQLLPFTADFDSTVRALIAAPADKKVIVGGDFDTVSGAKAHALVSLDPASGATNKTFPGWIEQNSVVKALNRDDTYFYLGAEGTGHKVFDGRIAGVLSTGARKWTDTCYGATQAVVPYKGVLYSGSHAHNCEDTPGGFPDINIRQHFLANSISDKKILTWFPDTNGGLGERLGPRAMAMAGDILWAGGEFTTVNGRPQQGLARFPAAPDTGAPQVPVLGGTSTGPGKVRLTWKAAWDRDDGTLTYRIYRDGAYLKSVTSDSRYWDRPEVGFDDTVAPGSKHRYSLEVTDGDNLSGRNGPVYVTAKK